MTSKRSNIEIFADILQIAKEGAKKSHIVYKANLNFKIANKYLHRLKQLGLINGPKTGTNTFETTKKGFEYLDQFETFQPYI